MTVEQSEQINTKEEIMDDMSEDEDKMAALKEMMAGKKKNKKPAEKLEEKPKRSLEFGIVGSGQAGSRLAECFFEYGYKAVCFNTAPQDLEQIKLPEDNKYLLEYGIGGAAKDTIIGHEAAESNREGIRNVVEENLGDADILVFCTSLGGGSGAGSVDVMVDILSSTEKPVVVVTVLPMQSEDVKTKSNALSTLSKLSKLAQDRIISNLIVVDNARLESIYSDVGHLDFFPITNKAIVEPIDRFNTLSRQSSMVKGMDSMEFAKIFTDGEGLCIYGEMQVPDWEDPTAIAKAVVEDFDSKLLAEGFDLSQTKYGGVLVVANKNVWNQIPRVSIDHAKALINEHTENTDSVIGTYVDDSIAEDIVKVYFMFSGLGLPSSRVIQLKKDVEAESAKVKAKAKGRAVNLTLDVGKDKTATQADEVREKIARSSSKFARNFAGPKDLRKK